MSDVNLLLTKGIKHFCNLLLHQYYLSKFSLPLLNFIIIMAKRNNFNVK